MKINRSTDYAIRLLAYLASGASETKSHELAACLDIPLNHLAKLVQNLSRAGYLLTRKGKGGGIRLAVDPKKVSLAEIIGLIEGPMDLNDCILHRDACRFSAKCKVRRKLALFRGKIMRMFEGTKLHELAPVN